MTDLNSELLSELKEKRSEIYDRLEAETNKYKEYIESLVTNREENTEFQFNFETDMLNRHGHELRVYLKNSDYFWGSSTFKFDIKLDTEGGYKGFSFSNSSGGQSGEAKDIDILRCFKSFMSHAEEINADVENNPQYHFKSLNRIGNITRELRSVNSKISTEVNELERQENENNLDLVKNSGIVSLADSNTVDELKDWLVSKDDFRKDNWQENYRTIIGYRDETGVNSKSMDFREFEIESFLSENNSLRLRVKDFGEERALKRSELDEFLSKVVKIDGHNMIQKPANYSRDSEIYTKMKKFIDNFESGKNRRESCTVSVADLVDLAKSQQSTIDFIKRKNESGDTKIKNKM